MYPGGGHRCGTGLREISWFFTFPRSGIEDSREFQYSQIPGKVSVFLPILSSLPPANPPQGGEAGVRQVFWFLIEFDFVVDDGAALVAHCAFYIHVSGEAVSETEEILAGVDRAAVADVEFR